MLARYPIYAKSNKFFEKIVAQWAFHFNVHPMEKINTLRTALKVARQKLASAQAELDLLLDDLRAFEEDYEAKVGQLLENLLMLEKEVNTYLERIRQLRDEQKYGNGYRPAEAQFAEKWRHVPEEPVGKTRPLPPPVEEGQIKKLYRQLARHYHPDLADNDTDRIRRNEKMAAINDAYSAGSVIELMALTEELDSETSNKMFNKLDSNAEKTMIEALQQELAYSKVRLRYLQQEIQNFHLRPLVEFALEVKLAKRQGRDLMAETAVELERQIARKSVERDMLVAQFNQL